jgi:hypothetical protein
VEVGEGGATSTIDGLTLTPPCSDMTYATSGTMAKSQPRGRVPFLIMVIPQALTPLLIEIIFPSCREPAYPSSSESPSQLSELLAYLPKGDTDVKVFARGTSLRQSVLELGTWHRSGNVRPDALNYSSFEVRAVVHFMTRSVQLRLDPVFWVGYNP